MEKYERVLSVGQQNVSPVDVAASLIDTWEPAPATARLLAHSRPQDPNSHQFVVLQVARRAGTAWQLLECRILFPASTLKTTPPADSLAAV